MQSALVQLHRVIHSSAIEAVKLEKWKSRAGRIGLLQPSAGRGGEFIRAGSKHERHDTPERLPYQHCHHEATPSLTWVAFDEGRSMHKGTKTAAA